MDFYGKIKELEYIHSKIEAERLNLERKIDQRKEYQKVFYDIRAQEINDELQKIEQLRVRNQARNEQLLQRVQQTLSQTVQNESLTRTRLSLEEAKKNFLRDLNKRDPQWRDKLRARKHDEIRRMELAKDKLVKELQERHKQLQEEQYLNEKLRIMREEYDDNQSQLNLVERRRRELQLQQEIGSKQRELDTIDRQLEENRRAEESMIENEQKYQQVDREIQQQENVNRINRQKQGQQQQYEQVQIKPKPPSGKENIGKKQKKESAIQEEKQQQAAKNQFDFNMGDDQQQQEEDKNNQSFNNHQEEQQYQQTQQFGAKQQDKSFNQMESSFNSNNQDNYFNQDPFNKTQQSNQNKHSQQQQQQDLNNSFTKQQSFNKNRAQHTFSPAKSNIQEEQVDDEFDDFLERKGSEKEVDYPIVNKPLDPPKEKNNKELQKKVVKEEIKIKPQQKMEQTQDKVQPQAQVKQQDSVKNATQSTSKSHTVGGNNKKRTSDLRKSKESIVDANGIKQVGALDFEDEEDVEEEEEEEEYEYNEEEDDDEDQEERKTDRNNDKIQAQNANQSPTKLQRASPVPPLNLDPSNLIKQQQEQKQKQELDANDNEYDEEEEDEDEYNGELDNEKDYDVDEIAIKIAPSNKISDTFMALNNEQRVFFFSIMADYIEQQMGKGAVTIGIYEKERTLKHDETMKFKIVNKYNELMDEFGGIDTQYELALVCDLILDVFRYKQKPVIDAVNAIADYKQSIKKGLPYQVKNLCQRIKNQNQQQMIDVLFDLIVKLREKKAIKSLNTCIGFVAESLLTNEQQNCLSDMESLCKYLIDQMTKKSTTGSQQKQSDQVVAFNSTSDQEPKKQSKADQQQPQKQPLPTQQQRAQEIAIDLDDEMRINIARELKEKIEKKITSNQINIQQQPLFVTYALTDENSIDELVMLTDQIQTEMSIPKDLDPQMMASLMLFMLVSREKPNIDQRDLVFLEESTDLNDFKGFIRDTSVKQLFDIIMKHFIVCIKKKIAKQKDIELLFTQAVVNFQCSDVEFILIKKYISDSINRALGFDNYSGGGIGGNSGSGTQNTLNSANPDFFNQQQQFYMKKSKQGSNQNSEKMLINAFSPQAQQQQKTNLKEFDDPEYYDEF
eukprot:403365623